MRRLHWQSLLPALLSLSLSASNSDAVAIAPTFTTAIAHPVGDQPYGVVTGDLNGDGLPDVVTANIGSSNVSVLLGTVTGSLSPHADFAVGLAPYAVGLGDFNEDGKLDVVAANFGNGTVSFLPGTGTGALGSRTNSVVDGYPIALRVADVNGDLHLDVVTANLLTPSVSVLLGNGNGTFQTRHDYPTGARPMCVEVGDVNGDGKPDVLTANYNANTFSILMGAGDGTFSPHVQRVTEYRPVALQLADLTSDGRPEVVVLNQGAHSLSVFVNTGSGQFAPQAVTSLTGDLAALLVYPGEGQLPPAVIVAERSAGSITSLAGFNGASFTDRADLAVPGALNGLASADVTRDGHRDLVATNSSGGTLLLLPNVSLQLLESVQLTSSTSASVYGEPVLLTCTVVPDTAIGQVDFRDGVVSLGVAALSGGVATFSTSSLLHGTHALTAEILRGGGWVGTSSPLLVEVARAATTLTLQPSSGATAHGDAVSFTAVIAVTAPGAGSPAGTVEFFADGASFGAAPLSGGVAVSPALSTLAPGTHAIQARYTPADTLTFLESEAAPTPHEVLPAAPTALALETSLSPAAHGDVVRFRATVTVTPESRGTPTGSVQFSVDGSPFGAAVATSNGLANSIETAQLLPGSHSVGARFVAIDTLRYLSADAVAIMQQIEAPAVTVTAVTSSVNPALQFNPVQFSANVTCGSAIAGVPAGAVQFVVDGESFGAPVTLGGGHATSGTTTALGPGPHPVIARYLPTDSLRFVASESPPLTQAVDSSGPIIAGVRDVPNDQGGKVHLTWRCAFDQPGQTAVRGYRVWRRVPAPTLSSGVAALRVTRSTGTDGVTNETFWEAIASLPAARLVSYGYTAETSQDSLPGSNPYTAFFVEALTASIEESLSSSPDSGYSVDNLSPAMPAPFVMVAVPGGTALHWGANRAADLREYRLYRGDAATFATDDAHLVMAGPDTGYVDTESGANSWYALTALDVHGNRSLVATVGPGAGSASLARLESTRATEESIQITWLAPGNPGITGTAYRQQGDGGWNAVAAMTADEFGRMSMRDPSVTSGGRYHYRLGIVDAGEESFAGYVWATASSPLQVSGLAGVWPNPTSGTLVGVRFTLQSRSAAQLDLLDVAGRRVASREVGAMGAGEHTLNLAEGLRLAPGIYLVRLATPQGVHTARAVVME